MRLKTLLCAVGLATGAMPGLNAVAADLLQPCQLAGVEHGALCGRLSRPLDPAQPMGRAIDLHFAVLPAVARNKKPDPVFFLAGGPGQSAIDLAGPVSRMLGRFANRRDIVLVDQRGTGRSAPLKCSEDKAAQPLHESTDPDRLAKRWRECQATLTALPYGDLRQFTTTIAMQDLDAVRQALGAERINLVGGSYGTRAALEYMRQFPQHVRRSVIDGVAPPDMVLPMSFSTDAQSAFDALLAACAGTAACQQAFPRLRDDWHTLLQQLPLTVTLQHPVTMRDERLTLTHDMVTSMVRLPLYAPLLASALPYAIHEAAQMRFGPMTGLASALGGSRRGMALAQGMHLSVVCAEDLPRLDKASDRPGADFGSGLADIYRQACADWPRGTVPAAFYQLPTSASATLILSGGIDPVTPPRHGERVAQALGRKARHIVVPNAGHGVMALGCMRDVVFHFIDDEDEAAALQVDARCATSIPRPPVFLPARPEGDR